MSSSLLVSKMENGAKELGIECKIWAVSIDTVFNHLDKADILLIGPQVRFMLPKLKRAGEENGFPVEVINTIHYGTLNGMEVLKVAIQLYRSKEVR
jgi:cellobiose PTS system EIIB component